MLEEHDVDANEVEGESSAPEQEPEVQEPVEQEESVEEAKPESEPKEEQKPFHEHPRFKELIDERNDLRSRLEALEKRAEKPAEASKDALVERLKGIDPEFGERFEKLDSSRQELEELRKWRKQAEANEIRTQVETRLSKLEDEYKVPEALRNVYRLELEQAARNNPKMGLDDISSAYKSVHEKFSKLFDNVKREERKKYVVDKRKDNVPTSPKGKVAAAKQEQKIPEGVDPRQYLLREIAKNAIAKHRSDNDL